ncbi:MAG: DUF5717 family protein [Lachnospiraceae bacterium]
MDSRIEPFRESEIAYGNGALEFDVPVVEIEAEAGKVYRGSFGIRVHSDREAVGRIYATDYRVNCSDEKFKGKSLEVPFTFDAVGMEYGDFVKGEFCIVSNMGEYFLPYEVRIPGAVTDGELGEIKNLFHFTNLAKLNWKEAVRCFYQEEFVHILTGSSRQYLEAYRALAENGRESAKPDFAMEQFLILIRKKQAVSYDCPVTDFLFSKGEEPENIAIRIRRNGWGYTDLAVEPDGSFLHTDKEHLSAEDFANDEAILNVKIDRRLLHAGKNEGLIRLTGKNDSITCRICIDGQRLIGDEQVNRRKDKQLADCMMRLYLDYRTGRRPVEESVLTASGLLEHARGMNALMPALYQAHLKLLTGQMNEAVWLLSHAKRMMEGKEIPLDIYGYFLYLTAMSEGEDKNRAGELLDSYVEQYPEHFVLYWGYMHKEGLAKKNPGAVYRKLKELWEQGCFHPVLYLEAAMVVMENPVLFHTMGPFEMQLLFFMDRYALITGKFTEQIYSAGEKIKDYHPQFVKLLEKYPSQDRKKMVKVMCLQYMRGNIKGDTAAGWLREGIELDCRITGLYEAYIYALDYKIKAGFPEEVVRYFAYDAAMDDGHLAYVYAGVIRQQAEITPDYEKRIRLFVLKQLEAGRIDSNLAYLYRNILMPEDMTEQVKEKLSELAFIHEVTVCDPKYKYCIVRHAGINGQERVSVKGGKALIRLYSDDYLLLFEDRDGLCHLQETGYEVHAFLGLDRIRILLKDCERVGFGALFCSLCRKPIDRMESREEFAAAERNYCWLLKQEELSDEYRRKLATGLMDAYVQWEMTEELDAFLEYAEATDFTGKDRARFVALLCSRGFYRKAFEAAGSYGYEKLDDKVLARLCQFMIEELEGEYDKQLLKLTYRVFEQGKYTEMMLIYLAEWFQGSVKQMRSVWRAAVSMEIPAVGIAEKILEQILYTGAYTADREKIFLYYSENGGRGELIRFYLSMRGEEYLVREEAVEDGVFRKMGIDMQNGEAFPLGAKLALLKFYSERVSELTEREKQLCRELLGESLGEDIYFPYYKAFTELYPVLEIYDEKSYVEYRTGTGSRVVIHYILDKPGNETDQYCREEMTEIYPGIFQKEFRLFWGERLQYYVTQEQNGEEQFVLSGSMEQSEAMYESGHGRYHLLNDIALSMELRDYDTADVLAKEYVRNEFLTKEMLKIR